MTAYLPPSICPSFVITIWIECSLAFDALYRTQSRTTHRAQRFRPTFPRGWPELSCRSCFTVANALGTRSQRDGRGVEADLKTLSILPHLLEVACCNERSSHVLVDDKVSVDGFELYLSERDEMEEIASDERLSFQVHGFHYPAA